MKEGKEKKSIKKLSNEIDSCISVLNQLLKDTDQLFDLPEEKRVALVKAAGLLSRPNKEEFEKRRKNAKKAAKRKITEREKHARKETGIRSARENVVFIAPKFLESTKNDNLSKLNSPRNCYVCKTLFTNLHHFYDTM
jgi:hypothetical protein